MKKIKSDDNLSMNEELKKWIEETKELDKSVLNFKEKAKTNLKKPSGKCMICGERAAKFVCLKCGRHVCSSCYFNIIGICKKCISEDVVKKLEEKHPDWEKRLGVDWVD